MSTRPARVAEKDGGRKEMLVPVTQAVITATQKAETGDGKFQGSWATDPLSVPDLPLEFPRVQNSQRVPLISLKSHPSKKLGHRTLVRMKGTFRAMTP